MEGSSISVRKKGEREPEQEELYVEEYTVAEVPIDSDEVQQDEEVEFHEADKEIVEEEVEEETIDMKYKDHQYISQSDSFQKIKEVKYANTKYIICSPDEQTTETYKASWTRGMTQILIEEYRNMIDDFKNPHKKQKDLWHELANNMCQRGCDVTWDMCDRKWRNLKHTFKTIYYNQHRSNKSKRRWEFYSDLEELFIAQGKEEGMRKSRTISPPPGLLDEEDSLQSDSLGHPSKLPRLATSITPQVSYAQVLDVSNLQNQIVSYPQFVICDESGVSLKKQNILSGAKIAGDESVKAEESPPTWFSEFMKQYRTDEERRLSVLKEMHAELIQVEKRKCLALESLLKRLVQ